MAMTSTDAFNPDSCGPLGILREILRRQRLWLWPLLILCTGCATSPFSKNLRKTAENQPSFAEISARPQAFEGRTVLLGGEIVQTHNEPGVSIIEVLQQPLDSSDRPEESDRSYGRFIIRCQGFLDPAIYAEGREITVAGEVEGVEERPLDQIRYRYPVIGCRQIHLWAARPDPAIYHPYPYWYDPRWRGWPGYYPYWYPYW